MRVVVVGAGSVGRSIARELLHNGHEVLIIDKDAREEQTLRVPDASWLLADAAEIDVLTEAGLEDSDVVVCATGDDKANLVVSLLAKTEFSVPRIVARVNNPRNEWMFNESWGVDVAVSTPRLMTALVEEALAVGDLVRIFEFQQGHAHISELTLPADSPYAGRRVADFLPKLPADSTMLAIIRDGRPIAPSEDNAVEPNDELLFLTTPGDEHALATLLSPNTKVRAAREEDD